MAKPLFVMKLGGSVITYKSHPTGKFRLRRLLEISQEIKQAKEKQDFNLILINGVGSYGHPIAKKYAIARGVKNNTQLRGLCEIKYITNYLTTKLNKIFLTAGLNVFSCQTSSLLIQNKGEIFSFNITPIKQLLKLRVIPMLSGDDVPDVSWGNSIISGDAVAPFLAQKLKATRVLFASDVDGIFDKDPHKYKNTRQFSKIDRKNFNTIIETTGTSSHTDVTGGMKGKLLSIRKYSHKKAKIMIFNGLRKNSVFEALSGKKIGTLIDLV